MTGIRSLISDHRRAIAVPVVITLVVVILITIFSLSRTSTDFYRLAVTEIKSVYIENFISGFFQETALHMNRMLNDPEDSVLGDLRAKLTDLSSGNSLAIDITPLLLNTGFKASYSATLKDMAEKMDLHFNAFLDDVRVTVDAAESIPVPKKMNVDPKEKKISFTMTAKATYMNVTREKGEVLFMKTVRITLPVLSKFTGFIKTADHKLTSGDGNGFNRCTGDSGYLLYNNAKCPGVILHNGHSETDLTKRGKVYIGNNSSNRVILRLAEEKDLPTSNAGNTPFSSIEECNIKTGVTVDKRGILRNCHKGSINSYYRGFGKSFSPARIFNDYNTDINGFFHPPDISALKTECGIDDLNITATANNLDSCSGLLISGINGKLSQTEAYGNVYCAFVRISTLKGAEALHYVAKTGSTPRDYYFVSDSTSFNNTTSFKYDTIMSTIYSYPSSHDRQIRGAGVYTDSDTAAGFSLADYCYADMKEFRAGTADTDGYKNGVEIRTCMNYKNEAAFRLANLVRKNSEADMNIRYGIVKVNGDLDLTFNGNVSRVYNHARSIIIVTGALKLPVIKKKTVYATCTFIVNKGVTFVGGNDNVEASIVCWEPSQNNLDVITIPFTLKGLLAVEQLHLEDNFLKVSSSSPIKNFDVEFDPQCSKNVYYFSCLPKRGHVW